MSRPSSGQLPRWADGGGASVTEPNSGKKDIGWVVGEKPAAQYFNWLLNRIWQFLAWLYASAAVKDEEQVFTFAQLFAPATGNKTAITAVGHGTGVGIDAGGSTAGSNGINGSGTRQSGGSPTAAGVGVQAGGNDYRAALNLVPQAAPLGTLYQNGDIYVSTDDDTIKARINGAWKTLHAVNDREAVHLVGSGGGEPAFQNSWANYGSTPGNTPLGFWKDALGVVHLSGDIASGSGSTVFTLPAGYRPVSSAVFPAVGDGAFGLLRVDPTGDVVVQAGAHTTYFSVNGISFRA